jgi:hypothetical protein
VAAWQLPLGSGALLGDTGDNGTGLQDLGQRLLWDTPLAAAAAADGSLVGQARRQALDALFGDALDGLPTWGIPSWVV